MKNIDKQIRILEHEVEYYTRVYKQCSKLNELKERLLKLNIIKIESKYKIQ